MEYIKEININEAVIHILDNNAEEPILNAYPLELTEEVYAFVFKHIQRCLNDEELKYALFNKERNIVKEISQEYLNGENNLLNVSKELASQMFILMRSKGNIPSCDLITVAFTTEYGAFLGIFKMDYIKNFMHNVDFVDGNVDINIVPQFTGLPSSSSKIQKCAFIKIINSDNEYDLLVLDKKARKTNIENEEYGSNWYMDNYLGCTVVENDRDKTKQFLKVAEKWTQNALNENAEGQEIVRRKLKRWLNEEDSIDLQEFSDEVFQDDAMKENFKTFAKESGVKDKVNLDKQWIEKKLKRTRLKIDRDIDLYINQETYKDSSRFEITKNGDGSINMTLKNITNYIEK